MRYYLAELNTVAALELILDAYFEQLFDRRNLDAAHANARR